MRMRSPTSPPPHLRAVFGPTELLWALIGLLLTIGGTFLPASIPSPPWVWGLHGVPTYPLGVSYQIGAVLLVGCLGGRNAGALAQIAYLALGLTWFPIFTEGGGIGYVREPTFGYLLGFVPGAWVCGYLAFKVLPRLESLALSCLSGLGIIHLTGMIYLTLGQWLHLPLKVDTPLWQTLLKYSLYPLPAQFSVICAVTVIAFLLRRLMFY